MYAPNTSSDVVGRRVVFVMHPRPGIGMHTWTCSGALRPATGPRTARARDQNLHQIRLQCPDSVSTCCFGRGADSKSSFLRVRVDWSHRSHRHRAGEGEAAAEPGTHTAIRQGRPQQSSAPPLALHEPTFIRSDVHGTSTQSSYHSHTWGTLTAQHSDGTQHSHRHHAHAHGTTQGERMGGESARCRRVTREGAWPAAAVAPPGASTPP
jgi:hypothetical protein